MSKYILTALCISIFTAAFAQKGFDIGVSGTANTTWILNQNNYGTLAPFTDPTVRSSEMNYTATWGGNAGISLGYNFTKNWGLRAELQYNVTGQKYEDNFDGPAIFNGDTFGSRLAYSVNVKRVIKLQYIQIPIMAKYMTKKGDIAKFFVCLGPQFGFRTYAYEQVKIADVVYVNPNFNYTSNDKFQVFDIGLALQAGTDIFITKHLYAEVAMSAYGGFFDINGKVLRSLDWYSKNDVSYQKSYNFRGGLMVGLHYIFFKGKDYKYKDQYSGN